MIIKKAYSKELPRIILKDVNIKLLAMMLIMAYFIFSDLYFRNNILAFYTRIVPTVLGFSLLIFNLVTPGKFLKQKASSYNILLLSLPLMMFAKCIIHLDDGLASNVSGTILVLFLISLELKTSFIKSILFFFVPSIAFIIVLGLFFELDKTHILQLSNIFPIIIIGYIVNRTQAVLRYENFRKTHLLKIAQERSNEQNRTLTAQKISLRSQANELKQLSQAKDKLFSIIAHDLRNPFNAIFGYSQLIQNKAIEIGDEDIGQYAGNIYTTAYSGYDLLNNLLHWARLQTGHLKYQPNEIYVDDLLQSSLLLLKANIEEKGLKLEVSSNPLISVVADSFMIESVIRNLISNAIKFSNKGGVIDVSVINQNNILSIKVKDSGIGIPESKLGDLFNMGNDYVRKGTNHEQGTGLGLMLCKEFIDQHNGEIRVESLVNMGSTFTILLPTHL